MKYAPFKLSAIVNRIDVRGNEAYSNGLNNSGETRFIFSLIAPVAGDFEYRSFFLTDTIQHGGVLVAGEVPEPFQMGDNGSAGLIGQLDRGADWKGMNVIFEYANVQTSWCAARDFAQEWADLSTKGAFGSTAYNNALQAITDQVTAASAAPGRPNSSAIGRVRTNERIFAPSGQSGYAGPGTQIAAAINSWELADWELRQFEIDPGTPGVKGSGSHLLKQVPVTNTPVSSANYATMYNCAGCGPTRNNLEFGPLTDNPTTPDPLIANTGNCDKLLDWAFDVSNRALIMSDRHVMPDKFPGTTIPMTAGSALLQMDYVHALDFHWDANTPNHPYTAHTSSVTGTYAPGVKYDADRNLRHKLSQNTCQGCHAGETKVLFTQVRPLGYGEAADYMGTVPGYESNFTRSLKIDARFSQNIGTTSVNYGTTTSPSWQHDPNYDKNAVNNNRYFVKVSPFLTGRNYSGAQGSPTYDDDSPDPLDNSDDRFVDHPNSFFVVNDPINISQTGYFLSPGDHKLQHSFNDLQRRQADLCSLISSDCPSPTGLRAAGSVSVDIMRHILQQPHIPGWH